MIYLLDTNILSHVARNPSSPAGRRVRALVPGEAGISVIAAAEIQFGLLKRSLPIMDARLAELFDLVETVPIEPPTDRIYAEIRVALERTGPPIGGNDYWIAAHAVALDCILVTDNEREFRRVSELKTENWLRQ